MISPKPYSLQRANGIAKLAQVDRLDDGHPRLDDRVSICGARCLVRLAQRCPELGQVNRPDPGAPRYERRISPGKGVEPLCYANAIDRRPKLFDVHCPDERALSRAA